MPEAHLGCWSWGSHPGGQVPVDGEELGPGDRSGATCCQHHKDRAAGKARPNHGTAARAATVAHRVVEPPRRPRARQLERSSTGRTALRERKWTMWAYLGPACEVNLDKGMGVWAPERAVLCHSHRRRESAPTRDRRWRSQSSQSRATEGRAGATAVEQEDLADTVEPPRRKRLPRPGGLRRRSIQAGGKEP